MLFVLPGAGKHAHPCRRSTQHGRGPGKVRALRNVVTVAVQTYLVVNFVFLILSFVAFSSSPDILARNAILARRNKKSGKLRLGATPAGSASSRMHSDGFAIPSST